jgi:hypothetical protein
VVGRFYNNIVYAGTGAIHHAVVEQHPNIDPEVFENNALRSSPTSAGGPSGLYRDEGDPGAAGCVPSGSGTTLTMIADVNLLGGASANLDNDCSVINPVVGGDFHLGTGSMCIDAGTATAAPATDFEGDARPRGAAPDIGPDEAM